MSLKHISGCEVLKHLLGQRTWNTAGNLFTLPFSLVLFSPTHSSENKTCRKMLKE